MLGSQGVLSTIATNQWDEPKKQEILCSEISYCHVAIQTKECIDHETTTQVLGDSRALDIGWARNKCLRLRLCCLNIISSF